MPKGRVVGTQTPSHFFDRRQSAGEMDTTNPEMNKWLQTRGFLHPGSYNDDYSAQTLVQGITVEQFLSKLTTKSALKQCIKEFDEVQSTSSYSATHSFSSHSKKNRYKDLPLDESTRIKLRDNLPGEYIHASYVHGYKHKRAYISSQAPVYETKVDFWRMIWQEQVVVVIMLTRLADDSGRDKCYAYWPLNINLHQRYGPFKVTTVAIEDYLKDGYVRTQLQVEDLRTNITRKLVQMVFIDWPDQDLPTSLPACLNFLQEIRKSQYQFTEISDWKGHPAGPPIVIHCSGGVGRTGAIEAIDICFQRLMDTGTVDIKKTVQVLRKQRLESVQNKAQYMLIYVAVVYLIKQEELSKLSQETLKKIADNF